MARRAQLGYELCSRECSFQNRIAIPQHSPHWFYNNTRSYCKGPETSSSSCLFFFFNSRPWPRKGEKRTLLTSFGQNGGKKPPELAAITHEHAIRTGGGCEANPRLRQWELCCEVQKWKNRKAYDWGFTRQSHWLELEEMWRVSEKMNICAETFAADVREFSGRERFTGGGGTCTAEKGFKIHVINTASSFRFHFGPTTCRKYSPLCAFFLNLFMRLGPYGCLDQLRHASIKKAEHLTLGLL